MAQQVAEALTRHPSAFLRDDGFDKGLEWIRRLPYVIFESCFCQPPQMVLCALARVRTLLVEPLLTTAPANGYEVGLLASFHPRIQLRRLKQRVDLCVASDLTQPNHVAIAARHDCIPGATSAECASMPGWKSTP